MYVRNLRLYRILQFVLDLLAVVIAWAYTIHVRILLNPITHLRVTSREAPGWAPSLAFVLALWLAMIWRLKLYRTPNHVRVWSSILWAAEGSLLATSAMVVVTFFSRHFGADVSRSFVLIFAPVSMMTLLASRCTSLGVTLAAERHWPSPVRTALLGDRNHAMRLVSQMRASNVAHAFKGLIIPAGQTADGFAFPVPILGTTSQLAELINREHLDRIVLLNGSISRGELDSCGKVFQRMGVIVNCTVDLGPEPGKINVSNQYGLPLVELVPSPFTRTQEMIKRGFDIVSASLMLLIAGPMMLVIAAAVKLTSEGPVLYKAPRVGKGGRHFMFLKFRSMYVSTDRSHVAHANEKNGHIFKMKQDPRVTPVGRFIRRYSLDELPQLINVLLGEMSLVGPRPLPAGDLDPDGMSRQFADWSEGRSGVYPGITGLWQVRGRSELPFEEMVRLDLEYIRNWSLLMDIKIILETPGFVMKGVGAY